MAVLERLFQSTLASAATAGDVEGIAVEAVDGALAEDATVPVDHDKGQLSPRPEIAYGA